MIFPADAIDDLWNLPADEFRQKYCGINITGLGPSDEGWYVRYRHENLTYLFGPLAEREDARKRKWDMETVRDAAIRNRAPLASSQVDFVRFTFSGCFWEARRWRTAAAAGRSGFRLTARAARMAIWTETAFRIPRTTTWMATGFRMARTRTADGDGIPNAEDGNMYGTGSGMEGDDGKNGPEGDLDGDGIANSKDDDMDGDGIPNGQDADADGDGIPNGQDGEPYGSGTGGGGGESDGRSGPNGDLDGDGIAEHQGRRHGRRWHSQRDRIRMKMATAFRTRRTTIVSATAPASPREIPRAGTVVQGGQAGSEGSESGSEGQQARRARRAISDRSPRINGAAAVPAGPARATGSAETTRAARTAK